jgi:hypothetical protein
MRDIEEKTMKTTNEQAKEKTMKTTNEQAKELGFECAAEYALNINGRMTAECEGNDWEMLQELLPEDCSDEVTNEALEAFLEGFKEISEPHNEAIEEAKGDAVLAVLATFTEDKDAEFAAEYAAMIRKYGPKTSPAWGNWGQASNGGFSVEARQVAPFREDVVAAVVEAEYEFEAQL